MVQEWTMHKLETQSGNLIPDEVRKLRNLVSHAKPLVTVPGLGTYLRVFTDLLPRDYQKNFRKSIEDCKDKLHVPENVLIRFGD